MMMVTGCCALAALILGLTVVALHRCPAQQQHALGLLVAGSFILHPYLCSIIFGTLGCVNVPGVGRFLAPSMHANCDSTEHQVGRAWAILMIFIIALGTPCAWGYMVWRQGGEANVALKPLFCGYRRGCWWWPLADTSYKLCITGFAVLVRPFCPPVGRYPLTVPLFDHRLLRDQ